jgi:hypothetical protein
VSRPVRPRREGHGQNKLLARLAGLHEQERPYEVVSIGEVGPDGPQMVVTAGQFGLPIKNFLGGSNLWDWDTDTIKCSLHTSTYVPDIDTHDFWSTTHERDHRHRLHGGGATLTSLGADVRHRERPDPAHASNTTWTTSTLTARIAAIYKSTGTSSTSPLICVRELRRGRGHDGGHVPDHVGRDRHLHHRHHLK